jgi:hypothetical protein
VISRKLQVAIAALVLAIFAMGGYLVHLKRKAESISSPPISETLTPPVNGPAEELVLYLASDEQNSLQVTAISSALPGDPGERGRLALHTLIARYLQKDSPHPLGPGSDLHDVYLLDPASAVVNLNAAFANSHRSGIQVEQLSVFSLVLTLKAQLPQVTRVRFLVDGKARDTLAGHIDLSIWYDVAAVSQAAAELK